MQNLENNKTEFNGEKLIDRIAKREKNKDMNELKFCIIDKFLPESKSRFYNKISRGFKKFVFREDFNFSRNYSIKDLANKLVEENLAENLEEGLKLVPELVEFEAVKYDNFYNYNYGFGSVNCNGSGIFYYAFKNEIVD